mgnify:CR=1 FL=1
MERPKRLIINFSAIENVNTFHAIKMRTRTISTAFFATAHYTHLAKKCGGQFRYLPNGNKDCSNCTFPHKRENYKAITSRYKEIAELIKRKKLIIIAQPQYSGIDIIFIYLFCLCLMCTADWYHSSISHIKQRPFKAYHIF